MYLGSVEVNKGKHAKFARGVKHPEFNRTILANDIGLVFLQERADGPYAVVEGTS